MYAPPLRRWRGQLPAWLARLGASGFPEAVISTGLFLYFEVFREPDVGQRSTEFLINAVICASAAVVGRWPRIGTIGVGVALTLMLLMPVGLLRLSALMLFIPLVSTGVRGHSRLCDIASMIYFALISAITIPLSGRITGQPQPAEAINSVVIWAIVIGLTRLATRSFDRLRRESQAQAAMRVEALRHQRRGIAHDLHDTVAYSTTTMIMRAEQMKLRATDETLLADLDFIITTGRRSVRDLRSMMETLRRNDPDLDAGAGSMWRLVRVSEVIEDRTAELAAHGLALQTQAPDELDQLPESVRETLAKLIVEATSNMVKHAAAGPCRLLVEIEDGNVEAVFTNSVDPQAVVTDEGLGLLGAAERIEALGGELEATSASGTWIVRAQLPIGE